MEEKPPCVMPEAVLSILFAVRDALQRAGRDAEVVEFLERAETVSADHLAELARDYIRES